MKTEDIIKEYGKPGENQVYCYLPYEMKLAWDDHVTITKFKCHSKVKDNLENIFKETLAVYGLQDIQALGLDVFGGCLNIRPMRGGIKPSVHSWGLAVDLDPVNNQLDYHCNQARLGSKEAQRFWTIVEKHGGVSLGRAKNYDWMHFQFIPIGD